MKHFVIGLAVLWLRIPNRALAEIKCAELEGAKQEAQLEYLQGDRSAQDAACVVYAMYQVGFGHNLKGVKTLAKYLDFHPPEDPVLARVLPSRDPYPATNALFEIGKPAVPELIEAIANSATSDIARRNAELTILSIYRGDLPEAVRVVKRAVEAKEPADWEGSQRLYDAARKISGRCRGDLAKVCMDAFYEKDENRKP